MNLSNVLTILAFLVPLTHAVGIVFAIHATLFGRTSQGSIAWALSLVFFPYVSIPLYLVFGRQKFHGYVEARRKGDRAIDHLTAAFLAAQQRARANLAGDQVRFEAFEHLAKRPFTAGNRAKLLIDGTATFDAIFAAIESARSYLLVQFFIIRDDSLGKRLQETLIKKAREGLNVCLLYDEIGCITLPARFFGRLSDAGVKVHAFNSSQGLRHRFQINFRNHRKIVIADGTLAFVGGHNVGEEYLGRSTRFGHWRDTHVQVSGPAVTAVQGAFIRDWHWATGEALEFASAPGSGNSDSGPGIVEHSSPVRHEPPAEPGAGGALCAAVVIPTSPADDISTCTLMFLAAISCARRRIWITSPYFVPDETVYDALQLAAVRGVDVRIMLPSKPDHVLVYLSSFSYLDSAEAVGVKFYRYSAGFLHQKVMLIDDDLAAVGTANLDNRSMRLNFELTLLFAGEAFAAEVATMLQHDFARCERATRGDLGRRGLPFQIAVRIARLLSPVQ